MQSERACIIGAGAAGLAAAFALSRAGIDFDVFEAGSKPGGLWRAENDSGMSSIYESLVTNTSAPNMMLFGHHLPQLGNSYLTHTQVLAYLESFACHTGLCSRIIPSTRVTQVIPLSSGDFQVTVQSSSSEHSVKRYGAVLVANGRNWCPRVPAIPGKFSGCALHAKQYRTPEIFCGQRVVIAGFGNTGADIAVDAAGQTGEVILSTRTGGHVSLRYSNGKPCDQNHRMWVHHLPRSVRYTLAKMRLRKRPISAKAVAALEKNAPFRAKPCVINDWLPALIDAGRVQVRPGIRELNGRTIVFTDGSRVEADILVWATGYKTSFPFFSPELMERNGNFVDRYLRVVAPSQPGLYFLGHAAIEGPVFPVLEQQAAWVAGLIAGTSRLPSEDALKKLAAGESAAARKTWTAASRPEDTVESYPYVCRVKRERDR